MQSSPTPHPLPDLFATHYFLLSGLEIQSESD